MDLSKDSSQPMHKDNYVICFNGEIYNFKKLRLELIDMGHSFLSNGDTEILISAWKEWEFLCLKVRWNVFFCYLGYQKQEFVFS